MIYAVILTGCIGSQLTARQNNDDDDSVQKSVCAASADQTAANSQSLRYRVVSQNKQLLSNYQYYWQPFLHCESKKLRPLHLSITFANTDRF